MKISQMRFQKAIVITAFVVAALTLVYAWIFSTDFFGLSYYTDFFKTLNDPIGYNYYDKIQPLNSRLELFGFLFLLIAVLLFLLRTFARRRYYLVNYITTGLYSGFGIFYGVFLLLNVMDFKNIYAKIDFKALVEEIYRSTYNSTMYDVENDAIAKKAAAGAIDTFKYRVSEDPKVFIIGIILAVIVVIVSVLLLLNAIWKIREQKKEDELYREEDAAIRKAQQEKAKLQAEEL